MRVLTVELRGSGGGRSVGDGNKIKDVIASEWICVPSQYYLLLPSITVSSLSNACEVTPIYHPLQLPTPKCRVHGYLASKSCATPL